MARPPPRAVSCGPLSRRAGQVLFRTQAGQEVDITTLSKAELQRLRREMQMVFQDPFTSLNPRMTLLDIVGEPLLVHGMKSRRGREERVAELLKLVGLRPEYMRRFPHAFSGGERQRIGIARAFALHPRLVIADEPVSALDVSVQAQILNLLLDLQAQLRLTYLFVAHDLSVVKHISDRVAVMYVGRMVELAPTEELFTTPQASLHRRSPVGRTRARPAPASATGRLTRGGGQPGQSAVWLLLPSALCLCTGDLPHPGPSLGRSLAWPLRALPPSRANSNSAVSRVWRARHVSQPRSNHASVWIA